MKLDLKNEVIEALPQDVALETVERVENSWLLTFSAKELDEGVRRQLWAMKYYDLQDNEYSINSYSSVDRDILMKKTRNILRFRVATNMNLLW